MSTLVIQTAFLGDAVLTLPLINRLAQRFGPVDVVLTPLAAQLLTGQPAIRRVIPYDKRGADRGLAGLNRVAAQLRGEAYQRAFLPHRSLRTAWLARKAGIPQRTGFAGGPAGWLHTHRIVRPDQGHETERLAALSGDRSAVTSPWFEISSNDRTNARMWLDAKGIREDFVVFAPGAAWATKRWPHYPALGATLDRPIVVIGGGDDRVTGEAIATSTAGRARNAAGELSLIQSAAVMAHAALVVSNDSLAFHLASALARPVVAIAGPTGPAPGFGPFSAAAQVVAHPTLACRPCSPHGHSRCPLGHHRCMRELTPEGVLDAVRGGLVG